MLYASFAFYYFNLRSLNRLLTFVSLFLRSIFTFFFLVLYFRQEFEACILYCLYCVNFGAAYATVGLSFQYLSTLSPCIPLLRTLSPHLSRTLFFFITLSIYDYAMSNYGRAARERENHS